ncbi:putative portal protein [Liberibacter crescens BT-1]|uniref:Putative portal protein n=1 Tax=Liberibacter crescens (strain BT-1) TaxID=1215343 RepID=L0EV94_LIBCB|nr:hypothetical protein [Liberibacter crescens]AGA64775.1 putative portal protein [Liberibacter crescens BT-1]AMC12844.1 phage portal protein [Liberibacter crescens]
MTMTGKKEKEQEFAGTIRRLVSDAEELLSQRQQIYQRSQEYYDGTMVDIPVMAGRSSVVSCDLRAIIRKIMPSLCRVLLAGKKVVDYHPVHQGDEEMAAAASDYVNHVVFPEAGGRDAVENAIYDALLCGNGILTWRYEMREKTQTSLHTGLSEAAFALLASDDDVDVLEYSRRQKDGVAVHDLRIRRKNRQGRVCIDAVPPDEFLIHPEAIDIDNSLLVGRKLSLSRSTLVSMGYDRDRIHRLPTARSGAGMHRSRSMQDADHALERIDYYELYVTVDYDGDGVAELRRVVMAGGTNEENILVNEEWDEVPFASLRALRYPHRFEGESLAASVAEIQRIKTVLLRQTLDNLYWQNQPQVIVQEGTILDPESVLNPQFGQPIRVTAGLDVRTALGMHGVPMVADKSFAMLDYLDRELIDRTGISDAAGGFSPELYQNMTATATALVEQGGIGQVELIVRTLAQGLERLFRGLLRLLVQHQDRARMTRLRDRWIEFDPRSWNVDMDASVNIGLGAGSRERDMVMMMNLLSLQKELISAFGVDNPFVSATNLYHGVARLAEAAGIQNVEHYFTCPDPESMKQGRDVVQAVDPLAAAEQNMHFEQALSRARLQAEIDLKREKMLAELQLKGQQMEAEILLKEKEQQTA